LKGQEETIPGHIPVPESGCGDDQIVRRAYRG
jgi:hypothetical protein